MGRTQESQIELRLPSDDRIGCGIGFQPLFEDALHAMDIDQIKVQSPAASRIEAIRAITIRQDFRFIRAGHAPHAGKIRLTRRSARHRILSQHSGFTVLYDGYVILRERGRRTCQFS